MAIFDKTRTFFKFLIFIMLCAGCSQAKRITVSEELSLIKVYLNKKTLNLNEAEKLVIHLKPSKVCNARIKVFNEIGESVATLLDERISQETQVAWDGKRNDGKKVYAGVYYYTIELNDGDQHVVYNPYPQTHGAMIERISASYDAEKSSILYDLPQAAMVRIRISLAKGGPIMTTLLDWTPQESGHHVLPWDGKDSSGRIDLGSHLDRMMYIFAYSLADNSFIVDGQEMPKSMRIQKSWTNKNDTGDLLPLELPADRYLHAKRDPRYRHAAAIDVILPQSQKENGIDMVRGIVPVRVDVAPEDQWIIENSRYELMFFVDTVPMFEDESAFTPYTFMWDTTKFPEGEHLLTVNLLTYDDQYAVKTKRVFVRKK